MSRKKQFQNFLRNNSRPLLFVAGFMVVGGLTLYLVKAASPSVAFEAENATKNGVSTISDASASAGSAIQFGGTSSSGNVGCAYAYAAYTCWASKTGVLNTTTTGDTTDTWSESQILAGQASAQLTHLGSSGSPAQIRMYSDGWQIGNGTKQSYNSGSGTSGSPYIFSDKWITGCIEVHTDFVTIRNTLVDFAPVPDALTGAGGESSCKGGRVGDANSGPSGRDETGSGSAINNGSHNTNPLHGLRFEHSEVDGHDIHITIGAQPGWTLDHANSHGTLNGVWLAGSATYPQVITHSYLHDVSASHAPGCTGFNTGQSGCPDDYHRENVFGQYADYISLTDSFFSIATTPAQSNAVGHSITGSIFMGDNGPNHTSWLLDGLWIDGAMEKPIDGPGPALNKIVYQNIWFGGVDRGLHFNGGPCGAPDWSTPGGSQNEFTGNITNIDRTHMFNVHGRKDDGTQVTLQSTNSSAPYYYYGVFSCAPQT